MLDADAALRLAVFVFVVSTLLVAGLDLTVAAIASALRNRREVVVALVASFLVAPLLDWLGAQVPGLSPALGAGLLVLGAAGGAPFLPLLAGLARADVALSVGLMVLLVTVTIGYVPLVLPLLLPAPPSARGCWPAPSC